MSKTTLSFLLLLLLIGCKTYNPYKAYKKVPFIHLDLKNANTDSIITVYDVGKNHIIGIDFSCDSMISVNGIKSYRNQIGTRLKEMICTYPNCEKGQIAFEDAWLFINHLAFDSECPETIQASYYLLWDYIDDFQRNRAKELEIPYPDSIASLEDLYNCHSSVLLNFARYQPELFRTPFVKLPPPSSDTIDISKYSPRNTLTIHLDSLNTIRVREMAVAFSAVRHIVKQYIANPNQSTILSESPKMALIILRTQSGTKYEDYLSLYEEITAVYKEIWNELSQAMFNSTFYSLSVSQQQKIKSHIPMILFEAEPENF